MVSGGRESEELQDFPSESTCHGVNGTAPETGAWG